ncbi:hypothetical protein [Azospirillum sp. sgz302134]
MPKETAQPASRRPASKQVKNLEAGQGGAEWRAFVLAVHREATITAQAKGLTGALAELAALQETTGLVSGKAGRSVGEEEVMRIILNARRARRRRCEEALRVEAAVAPAATETAGEVPEEPVPDTPKKRTVVRLRRGRIAPLALRPLVRALSATVR